MHRVCRELQRRGVRMNELRALELFGADGDRHVRDYAGLVSSLEIWEIDPGCEKALRQRFPKATVRIVDSYEQIKKTSDRYDLIVADSPCERLYGGHCEHFDLFPDLFRVASASAILVLNILPRFDEELRRRWSFLFNEDDVAAHSAQRQSFYKTMRPDHISLQELAEVYEGLARANGFEPDWHFFQKRQYYYYLVLKLRRSDAGPPGGTLSAA